MHISDLNKNNITEYHPLAISDEIENIERSCYSGYMAYEETASVGAIMWNDREEGEETKDEISFFAADSEEAAKKLLRSHEAHADESGIGYSHIEMSDMSAFIRAALSGENYDLVETEGMDIIIKTSDLVKSRIGRTKVPSYVVNIGSLQGMEFWNGLTYCLYNGRKGMLEDLDSLREDWFDPDLSCCVKTDKWVEGLLLIHRLASGTLMPVLFFCGGRDERKNLMYMMRYAMSAAIKKYPPATPVLFHRHNQSTKNIISYLFPKAKGEMVVRGEKTRIR